jgi:hypothetical protein
MRISVSIFSALAAIAVVMAVPNVAHTQNTITLEGSVRNAAAEPVVGAVVAVTNPATNERRGVNTNEMGRFRVLGLGPGRYEVVVRAIGFEQETQMVELLLGQRANVVFDLRPTATQLVGVEVTADRTTTVEVQRTSVSAPVVQQMIEQLPTIDRNIMTLAAVTPGVKGFAPQSGRALPSAGAMPELRFNNFYLDGVELKSLFNGNLVGIPQTGAPVPQEAIQEFRVFINPYDAEYSHAGAYVISAESNRGTNDRRGAIFGFFQNQEMVATTSIQRRVPNFKLPDFKRLQLGFNLRGPIQRDRLFYALNYEITDTDNIIDVVPGNATQWAQYAGSFKAPTVNHTGFLRTTFTPSERNSFDVSWSTRYLTGESNFGGTVARDGGIDQTYFINIAQLRHRYLPTPSVLNELSLQMVHWHHDEGMLVEREQRLYPTITLGTATFPLELNELHMRIVDRLSYTKDNWGGSHLFKAGAEVSRITADQFSPNFRLGEFRFGTDVATQPNRARIGIGYQDREGVTDAKAELSGWITGFYLNDEWRPSSTLTLNLGIRYDAEINTLNNDFTVPWASDTAISNKAAIADYVNRGDRKNDLNNISPRISFSWDPTGANRTFIRGGFGIIYDRVASFIGFQERLAATWRTYTIINPSTTDVPTLRQQIINSPTPPPVNLVLVKKKMEAPENRQLSVGMGHQFTDDLAFNVDYVHQDVRHLYNRLNANYLNTATGQRVLTPNYADIVLWDDFAKAKFDAVMLSVNYRRAQFLTNLAYTLGYYKADYDAVTAPAYAFRSSYNMQRTAGDERHRIVLSEVADFAKWGGLQIAAIVTLGSPRPYGAFIGTDLNRDGDETDDFFPDSLDAPVGPYGPPNGVRTLHPGNDWKFWYRNVDLRLGKSLFTAQGTTVRLTAEVFNVFNTDNISSFAGRKRNASYALLSGFGQPNGAFGARRAQVGARFEF